jgi:tetratricopeptide (TPR) repeat protein
LLRQLDSPQVLGQALMYRGVLAVQEGDEEGALPILEEGLSLFHTTSDQMFISITQMHLANAVMGWYDLPRAQEYLEQSLANARAQGDQVGEVWVIALVLNNLGELARMQGDYRKAEALYIESMELLGIVNARGDLTRAIHSRAYSRLMEGDVAGARQYFEQSLSEFRRLSLQRGVCESLAGLARVLALEGQPARGATLLGYAQSMLDGLALRWWPADRIEINTTRKLLVEKLGSEAFGVHYERGQALSLEAAFELANARGAGVNSRA